MASLCAVLIAALLAVSSARVSPPTPAPAHTTGPRAGIARVGSVNAGTGIESPTAGSGRAELIDYNPVAAPGAIVLASDRMARFSV